MSEPDPSLPLRERAAAVVQRAQSLICDALEAIEREGGGQARFLPDSWERDGGGGGTARVLTDGTVFEKGGVNVSVVHGELSEELAARLPGSGREFYATGVSLVIHPRNPHVPTAHANFRFLEHGDRSWVGGGGDLTPYYYQADDEDHFHGVWRGLCEAHPDVTDYPKWKDWCDAYFHLPHRGERRGVGGIFFDYVWVDPDDAGHGDRLLALLAAGGQAFVDAYAPIVRRRMHEPWTDAQRSWQLLRRGRYVEFNLLYDRGTVFGLKTGGRTESILMSLPPHARWGYCEEPEPGTPEHALLERLRQPVPPIPTEEG